MAQTSNVMVPGLVEADVMLGLAGMLMILMVLLRMFAIPAAPTYEAPHWVATSTGLWTSEIGHISVDALASADLPILDHLNLSVDPDGLEAAFLSESRLAQLGLSEITLIRRTTPCLRRIEEGRLSCAP